MKPILEVHGIGKAFSRKASPSSVFFSMLREGRSQESDPFWAVRDVSFTLGRGEAVGIIGRNGSGKSTLLQLICGISPPSEGRIICNGRIAGLLELGAGFDPEFSGRENVYLNAAILGLTRDQIDSRYPEIEAFADIGRFIDEPVRTYSSGMFVRLAFAVAVHVGPEILIIDEALSVGDARFAAKCIKKIREMREGGTTLLFVSHDVGIVRTLCDRAIWMDGGRLRQYGDVFSVTSSYMEYLFEDDEVASKTGDTTAPCDGPQSTSSDVSQPLSAPLARWGSRVGSVVGFLVTSQGRRNPAVIEYGDALTVEIEVDLPPDVATSNLSVAFSIKNTNGLDLLVCTTHDENPGILSGHSGRVTVAFDFVNRLVEGRYFFVAALEDRSTDAIEYFDYVEGAHFFAGASRRRRFGVFNLPVAVRIKP